jgi:hypothetical protein
MTTSAAAAVHTPAIAEPTNVRAGAPSPGRRLHANPKSDQANATARRS